MGWSEDVFKVHKLSFDDLSPLHGSKFDLVIGNECFIHSASRDKLIGTISNLLHKGGILLVSDTLYNARSSEDDLKAIKARFSVCKVATLEEYTELLSKHKFEKISQVMRTENLARHYGLVRYYATGPKKEQMLHHEHGVSKEFFDRTVAGLDQWCTAAAGNHIQHAWFTYRNTVDS